MLSRPQKSMTTRSSPTPAPPWGGAPNLRLATQHTTSGPLLLSAQPGQQRSTAAAARPRSGAALAAHLNESMYDWMVSRGRPISCARCVSRAGSWMRCAPEMISSPRRKMSKEQE